MLHFACLQDQQFKAGSQAADIRIHTNREHTHDNLIQAYLRVSVTQKPVTQKSHCGVKSSHRANHTCCYKVDLNSLLPLLCVKHSSVTVRYTNRYTHNNRHKQTYPYKISLYSVACRGHDLRLVKRAPFVLHRALKWRLFRKTATSEQEQTVMNLDFIIIIVLIYKGSSRQ